MLYWVIKNHPVEGICAERSFSDRARSLKLSPFFSKCQILDKLAESHSQPANICLSVTNQAAVGLTDSSEKKLLLKTEEFDKYGIV